MKTETSQQFDRVIREPKRHDIAGIDRVVREPERHKITGVPPSSWYPLQNQGLAPKPIPLSARNVGWVLSELLAWIDTQRAKREKPPLPD
jgi:predicted DNA-binding transcriptional regulator AlpA